MALTLVASPLFENTSFTTLPPVGGLAPARVKPALRLAGGPAVLKSYV